MPKPKVKPRRRPVAAARPSAAAAQIMKILDDQKATEIRHILLTNHVADAFIIATAAGTRHLHSLADHLLEKMREAGTAAHHVEGHGGSGSPSERWVLVDYLGVVVHLFTEEGRRFYALDRLFESTP
ncbi:ribosome silencing factor [bacterium]|nr:ribosome silencing factor [bacterium]